jgi:type I restriction enzyme S subunit
LGGKEIGEIAKINYGYTEKASFAEIGPKFLRITDIQDNGVKWETVPYCKCSKEDLLKYKLATGDIVFARTGANNCKSYLLKHPPNAVFASYLIRLKLLLNLELVPELVFLYFQSGTYWKAINTGISGSAQGGFNATKLSELKISFPIDFQEQQNIIFQLNSLSTQTQKLESLISKS